LIELAIARGEIWHRRQLSDRPEAVVRITNEGRHVCLIAQGLPDKSEKCNFWFPTAKSFPIEISKGNYSVRGNVYFSRPAPDGSYPWNRHRDSRNSFY
jgi:hypothetical protein